MATEIGEPLVDTVTAAAQRVGISRATLYREIKAGKLRAVKAARRTLITRADQEAWVASLTELNTAAGS